MLDAPKEIDDEWNLRQTHDPRRPRDGRIPLEPAQTPNVFAGKRPALAAIVPAPMHAEHSLQKHRQKNNVHADERRPEMHVAPELVHGAAGRFWEPIIDAGEQSEDRTRRDDVM